MLERVDWPISRPAVALWLIVGLCLALRADGAETSRSITVSATNAPSLRAETVSRPASLTITDVDIERGFIDVVDAGMLAFQTNNPSGTMLLLSLEDGPVASAEVTASGIVRTIGIAGGWIDIPFSGTGKQRLGVACRLFLREGAMPGVVPWPLAFEGRMSGVRVPRSSIACKSCERPAAKPVSIAARK